MLDSNTLNPLTVYKKKKKMSWPCQLWLLNTPTASLQWGKTPPKRCSGYNSKQSDGEAPVMLEVWEYLFIAITPSSTHAWCSST